MKQFIYVFILLMVINSQRVSAQGDIPDPEPEPSPCCNTPGGGTLYTCSSPGSFDACSMSNFDFESTNYFEHWKGNAFAACWPLVWGTFVDFAPYTAKAHGGAFSIVDPSSPQIDPFCGFNTRYTATGGIQSARIGDYLASAVGSELINTIKVYKDNPYISLLYALVLEDGKHPYDQQPYFSITIYNENCQSIPAAYYKVAAGEYYLSRSGAYTYKDWTKRVFDMSRFFVNPAHTEEEFTIVIRAFDCMLCGHKGYAYIDGVCGNNVVIKQPDPEDPEADASCVGADLLFNAEQEVFYDETYVWDFGDGKGWSTDKDPRYFYSKPGTYTVNCTVHSEKGNIPEPHNAYPVTSKVTVVVEDCCELENAEKIQQDNCITAFAPIEGESYILHAWVREDVSTLGSDHRINTYKRTGIPHIRLKFFNGTPDIPVDVQWIDCFPSGPIIDGWQRVEHEFVVPSCPEERMNFAMILNGMNLSNDENTYFDDIRIFPKKGGMKSFVYDPVSQKLVAELDEENFATFYEYDQEGNLIRIKRETERGIKTIKEAGTNTSKKP